MKNFRWEAQQYLGQLLDGFEQALESAERRDHRKIPRGHRGIPQRERFNLRRRRRRCAAVRESTNHVCIGRHFDSAR